MTMSGASLKFGIGAVLGVVTVLPITSLFQGHFRWEACDDAREMRRQILGGFLMGFGGVTALGCTVGQGLSAASVLAWSAPLALASIFIGAWFGLHTPCRVDRFWNRCVVYWDRGTDRLLDAASVFYTFKKMIMLSRISVSALVSTFASPVAAADRDYGEYLSSECVTCHRTGATDAQIPSIAGMDGGGFIAVMKSYRAKTLENPTMQIVAKRLTDEDIASLAAYYSSLGAAD